MECRVSRFKYLPLSWLHLFYRCIMLELFTKKPVFQGADELQQIYVVYRIMGTPTADTWPGVTSLPWYEIFKPNEFIPNRFRELFKKWAVSSYFHQCFPDSRYFQVVVACRSRSCRTVAVMESGASYNGDAGSRSAILQPGTTACCDASWVCTVVVDRLIRSLIPFI